MKALPCRTSGCTGHSQLPGVATLKDGSPYLIGRPPVHFPHGIHCATCKRKTWLTQVEWNALPHLKAEDIAHVKGSDDPKDHADFGVMTRSLRGDG